MNWRRDSSCMLISTPHTNPIMHSHEYHIQFHDSQYTNYSAKLLLEIIYSQVDKYESIYELLKGRIDHRVMEDTIPK